MPRDDPGPRARRVPAWRSRRWRLAVVLYPGALLRGRRSSSATSTSTGTRGSPRSCAASTRAPGRSGSRGSASGSRSSPTRACRSSTRSPGSRWLLPWGTAYTAFVLVNLLVARSRRSGSPRGSGPAAPARGPRGSAFVLSGPRAVGAEPLAPLRRYRHGCRGCCWPFDTRRARPAIGSALGLAGGSRAAGARPARPTSAP